MAVRRSLLTAFCLTTALSGTAWAQTPAPEAPAAPAVEAPADEDEIVVRGVRGSLQRALEIERNALSVVSVITADDIGQFADQNIAESLQRVAGVTIDRNEGEGRNIRVRGLSSDFNQVTINGAQIGSSDASGGRSVTLDVISSELLVGVEVAKALTPDQDHDSLGALVDLRTLSAFDRPGTTLNLRAEGSYGERVDKISPKIAANGTVRLLDDRLGLAFAVNYFDRDIQLDQLRNDAAGFFQRVARNDTTGRIALLGSDLEDNPVPAGSTEFLRPQEADQRLEVGTRERLGGTFGIEFRADGQNRFGLNVIAARLNDNDIRIQQETEFRRSDSGNNPTTGAPGRIIAIGPREGQLARVDVEKQITFQDNVDQVFALNFESDNRLTERLRLRTAADYSHNRFHLRNALRGRFRERLVPVTYAATRDSVDITYIPVPPPAPPATDFPDPLDPRKFEYDNILTYDEYRTDEILSYGLDLSYDFELFGGESVLQFGVKQRERDKVIRRAELSRDFETPAQRAPLAGQFALTLDQLPLTTLQRTNLTNVTFFPTLGPARALFQQTKDFFGLDTRNSTVRNDYDASEDVLAGYGMLTLNPSPQFSAILGVRVEKTRYRASGTVTTDIERDTRDFSSETVTGPAGGRDYTEWLPSLHLRWEPSPRFVARLVLSRQQVRPAFDDVRGNQEITVEQTTLPSGVVRTDLRVLEGGNPQLKPLTANAVDATLGWYPSPDLNITAAAFYKDLKDPFVSAEFSGAEVALTGNPVFDPATGLGFTDVDVAGNAGKGRLAGVELNFAYFARSLPRPFDGLFASGNVTLIDGQIQSDKVRAGAKLPLNNQPSVIANASVGYENDTFSLRWSGNYVGRSLQSVNTNPAYDRFNAPFFTMDVNARLNITKWLQVYADAININEARDMRFYRGNGGGGFYERIDDYGRTFQAGVTVNLGF